MTGQLPHVAAALCAGAGAWFLTDGTPRRNRLLLRPTCAPAPPPRRLSPGPLDAHDRRVALGALALGLVLAAWSRSPLPLAFAAALAPLAVRRWRTIRRARASERRRKEVVTFCASLAGEVRAGRTPVQALAAVPPEGLGEHGAALGAAARYGGDIPAALDRAAGQPGAEGLRGVAACWAVAVDGGASLATGLERVAEVLRAEQAQREELRAQLAGPRATTFLLAGLPLFGVLLGAAMGVRPLEVLLHTTPGLICLVLGAALEWAGIAWVAAIVRRAERSAS
ncbi:type II secretion system F family protein [Streptomyces avicenniae]|uniref:type II secretion system F family protein n=1 Tax=Streptomyces avicenniae TaxID=500153 RepID=UPI00069C1F5A|nr:type II secretion system F family protein [Streptomyces avicenniae]